MGDTKINNNNRLHKRKRVTPLTQSQWRQLIDRYITGKYSQYELTEWANNQFNRNSGAMVYNNIINGKCYKDWYALLTQNELDAIKATIAKYKTYYR